MNCAEDFLKFVSHSVSENCYENLYFLSKRVDKTLIDRLQSMTSASFEKITYDTAVEVLNKVFLYCYFYYYDTFNVKKK